MKKNDKKSPATKMYIVCGTALAAMVSFFTVSSCKKGTISVTGVASTSSAPITHDKPYTFFSNTDKQVAILVEDASGNWVLLDKSSKNSLRNVSTCGGDSYAATLVYRGYTNEDVCFNGLSGASNLSHSWDLYLPEDVSIVNDATCVARVKIGPVGFSTAPAGVGFRTTPYQYHYVETVDIDGAGTMMKKWRLVSNPTPFSGFDYCVNSTLTPTFKLKTDCPDLATIQPALTTDYLDVNSLTIPALYTYDGTDGTGKKIEFVPNLPICGSGCHGYWKWCTNYKIQTKLTTSATWSATTDRYSNSITSFKVGISNVSGTYQIRYKGLIRGSLTSSAVWSDWVQPASTVYIP